MSETTFDWMNFFVSSIDAIHERLAVVVTATGCREGWLQGELFLAGRRYDLRVNECQLGNHRKADLSCGNPVKMIAEIKIVSGGFFPKMRYAIDVDVERMREVTIPDAERYMILVIPQYDIKTTLGDYLDSCSFSSTCVGSQMARVPA